jgi:hypothetical protein
MQYNNIIIKTKTTVRSIRRYLHWFIIFKKTSYFTLTFAKFTNMEDNTTCFPVAKSRIFNLYRFCTSTKIK